MESKVAPAIRLNPGLRSRNGAGTYAGDGDRGIAEEEELVQAGEDDGPDEADEPGPEGVHGHVRVVGVGDGRTDLRVR